MKTGVQVVCKLCGGEVAQVVGRGRPREQHPQCKEVSDRLAQLVRALDAAVPARPERVERVKLIDAVQGTMQHTANRVRNAWANPAKKSRVK